MKKQLFTLLIATGLVQFAGAADLVWLPGTDVWDTSSLNWSNTATTLPAAFAPADNVRFDDAGLAQPIVKLVGSLSVGTLVVDSESDYLIRTNAVSTDGIGSLTSLTKRGGGKLALESDNGFGGPVVIEAGTLQIGNGSARGTLGTSAITNHSILAFNRSGTLNFNNSLSGTGKLFLPATANGTWNLRGSNTMVDYSIEHSGAILYFTNSFSLGSPTNIQINVSSANQRLQMGGGVHLPASCPITFTVPAGDINTRAALMGVAGTNSINGPIRISGGSYADANSRPNVSLYNNTAANLQITVNSSVEDVPGDPFQGNFLLRGNSAAGIGRMFGTINLSAAQLIKEEASTWTIYSSGNSATLTYIANGRLNLAAADALPNAQLTVNATLDLGGYDQHVGPLWSLGTATTGLITNSSTSSDALLTLSDGGVYYGVIKDGLSRKVGIKILSAAIPHSQQFHGVCTYSGPTTLQPAAALALMGGGSIPNSTPIELANGSSIDVTAKSDLTFTLGSLQTLKADGTVHIAGNFVNQGKVALKVNKAGGVVTSDSIAIGSGYAATYGGTLQLELSGEALATTDSLKIFEATSYSGSFTNFVPPTPGAGLAWDTGTLTNDGTLRVMTGIATNPTNITWMVTGGTQLQLTWPADHLGWTLQAQTNANSVGLGSNWFDVPDSASTNELYLPIDRSQGGVYYRLRY